MFSTNKILVKYRFHNYFLYIIYKYLKYYLRAIYSKYFKYLILTPLKMTIKSLSMIRKGDSSFASNRNGFTLIELIVIVCILAILATIATPSVLTQLATLEAKRIKYAITSTLTIAQIESYVRRRNSIVCLSNSTGRCNKNDSDKLLVFFDSNNNNNFDAGIDELLEQQRLAPRYARLQLRAGNRHYIKFWGDSGKPRGFFGHIKYCPTATYNHIKYQISFNQQGISKYKPNETHPTGC